MIPDTIKIEKSIDWVTATFPYEWSDLPTKQRQEWNLPLVSAFNVKTMTQPTRYYKRAMELECGGTLEFSDYTEGVKPHAKLNLTGDNMRSFRNGKMTDSGLVYWLLHNAQNITRIDFAIDLFGGGSPKELLRGVESGEVTTNSKVEHYEAIKGLRGHTVYFGSKKSDLRLRVYDKAAEVGLLNEVWTRIELQSRRDYAWALAEDMNTHGVGVGGTMRVNKMVKAPALEWWNLAINETGKPSSGYHEGDNNWRLWVKNTVLPSLLDHADTDKDILAMVLQELSKVIGSEK